MISPKAANVKRAFFMRFPGGLLILAVVVSVRFSALLPPRPTLVTLRILSLTKFALPLQQFFNLFWGVATDSYGFAFPAHPRPAIGWPGLEGVQRGFSEVYRDFPGMGF